MVPVYTLAGQGRIRQMREILCAYGKFIQHPMKFLDREALLRGRRRGPVSAQNLESQSFWFYPTPSSFRRVRGYKFLVEFDCQGHGGLLRSLSAYVGLKRKLEKGAEAKSLKFRGSRA